MFFRKEKEIKGHSGAIYSCAFDGTFVYSGSADKFIARWIPAEGIQDKFAIKFEHTIYAVETYGDLVIAGRSDGGLHVFNAQKRSEQHYFTQHTQAIFAIATNEYKNHCYAGDADGNFSVWDLKTWDLLLYLPLNCGKIRDIAIQEDGSLIALAAQDGTLRIFDTETFNEIHTIQAHKGGTTALCFIPGNTLLVSGGKDAMLRLWDFRFENCLKEVPAHNFAIYRILLMGEQLVTLSRDKSIKIWSHDLEFLQKLDAKSGGHKHSVNDGIRIDSERFVTCGDDKRLIFWKKD